MAPQTMMVTEPMGALPDDPEEILEWIIDPDRRGELYPLYHRLREVAPVHKTEQERLQRAWVLTRFDDGTALVRNTRAVNDTATAKWYDTGTGGAFAETMANAMLFLEPEDHERLRSLVVRAFTPKAVEALRPRTQQVVDDLLDAAESDGEMDLVRQFAYPLPIAVISSMMGVPPEDQVALRQWAWDFARRGDLSNISPEVHCKGEDAALGFTDYLQHLMKLRRADPGDDLVSALLAVEENGDRLAPPEVISTCILLLQAGHETTADLIGNAVVALFRHPDQLERLRRHPELIKSATEEFLRYDTSVQVNMRVLLDPMEVTGHTLPAGALVAIFMGASNRDPARFSSPDTLDLGRPDNQHVSFAHGAYYCVGAALARAETQVAIGSLVTRFPKLRPVHEVPNWRSTLVLRGLKDMPVVW